ncbi:zinc finger B-box domain-containing protein 1 isoform X2 [Cuculus canorus]|uniref:zinc finger B-box domain-containing protein 1 isoform X2 n=1 Tax=Cuculus canorus TaxID=55661 RepID=UPI0023AACF64|nr:zinc finger B-box domain-containing protein 1 isoform X2 [Cuculus canorus]
MCSWGKPTNLTEKIILGIMNIKDLVILPDSKSLTSVRFKAKTVRELQLEKVRLEAENGEMEKKLRQLQSKMSREKEERKKSRAYHWKSGQAGPMTIQAQALSQSKRNNNKVACLQVSSGKVKLQILKEQIQVKEPFEHEKANAIAHEKSEAKGIACGLCETKNALLTEANIHAGKLQAVDHFIKDVNLNESKINHKQKEVNSKHRVTSDKFSSLLAPAGVAEELSSESTCTGLENQEKELLLNGTFNEEESAKSFQEVLLQWRKGNQEQPHAKDVLSESVGICEVQTNLNVPKEPIQIEFKKDGLSYMEKLLLKKYRRTPVDQISGSCNKDLRPVQTLSVHQAGIGGDGEGDDGDEVDDLTAEEVKRHWASVFVEEEPNAISENVESYLKIEFLDDSYGKDLELSSDSLLVEAGVMRMNQQRKTEPFKQYGRNPVSSKEVLQEKMVVCSPERNTVQKESVKQKTMRRSLSFCELPEKISSPTELMSNKYLPETQRQKTSKDLQELDSVCNSQSLVLPIITKSSVGLG